MTGFDQGGGRKPDALPRRIDLNLALTFLAVLREGSVSQAAAQLALTQSAVSASLRRLRQICGDDLFIRSRDGMTPTRRALAMAEPVTEAIGLLREAMLGDGGFDPAHARRQFVIGFAPGLEAAVGPAILRRLIKTAPGVTVRFREGSDLELTGMLEGHTAEIGVGLLSQRPTRLHQDILGTVRFACLLDPLACKVRLPLDLESYLELPHVLSSAARRDGPVDLALRAIGRQRRIASAVTHFSALPAFLIGMRAVGTVPVYAARAMAAACPALAVTEAPLAIPTLELALSLTRDGLSDPGIAWLRELVGEEVRAALCLPWQTGALTSASAPAADRPAGG